MLTTFQPAHQMAFGIPRVPKNLNTPPSPPWIAMNASDPSDWTTETVTNSIPSRRGSWPLQTSEPRTRAADRPQSRRKAAKAPKRWLVYEHHSSGSKLVKICWDDPMERKKAKTASEADSKASSVPFYVASPPHEKGTPRNRSILAQQHILTDSERPSSLEEVNGREDE